MDNNVTNEKMPLGLGNAFARNTQAMNYFSSLSQEEQNTVINEAKNVRTKKEMRSYVANLASKGQVQ